MRFSQITWAWLVVSILLVGLLSFVCMSLAREGALGPVIAFIVAGISSIIFWSSCFVAVVFLPGKQKLLACALALLVPVTFLVSIQIGDKYSLESLIKRNGDAIILALARYHADNGTYPSKLEVLVPSYLFDLKQPPTVWGWLYTTTDREFVFGFVENVDRYGYSINVYRSDLSDWDYTPYSSAPFKLSSTPMPQGWELPK